MSPAETLDVDALVRKHVWIVPSCRFFQIASWAVLMVVLLYLAVLVCTVVADIIWFGAGTINSRHYGAALLQLDFKFTRNIVDYVLAEQIRKLSWVTLIDLGIRWLLAIFVALSLISFRLDRILIVALIYLAVRAVFSNVNDMILAGANWKGGVDLTLAPMVTAGWNMLLFGYFWIFLLMTLRQLYALPELERTTLREGATDTRFARASFLHAFGIPPNVRNAARRFRTVLLAYLANLVGFGPVALFVLSVPLMYVAFYPVARPFITGEYDPARSQAAQYAPFSVLLFHVVSVALTVLVVLALVMTFRLAGNAGLRLSRRFMRVSLEQAQAADQRRPVLFLRSFQDDAVVLAPPPAPFAYKLFNYADRKKSLDELLLEEGTIFGPVVALGKPGDVVPPYGAARGYAKHSDWQELVSHLMEAAAAIVICIDDTPSLWWEVEQLARPAFLAKTLVLLHPKYVDHVGAPQMIGRLEQAFGWPLAAAPTDRGRIFGVWHDPAHGLRIGLASRFSRGHYLLMLRWFLRSRLENAS